MNDNTILDTDIPALPDLSHLDHRSIEAIWQAHAMMNALAEIARRIHTSDRATAGDMYRLHRRMADVSVAFAEAMAVDVPKAMR